MSAQQFDQLSQTYKYELSTMWCTIKEWKWGKYKWWIWFTWFMCKCIHRRGVQRKNKNKIARSIWCCCIFGYTWFAALINPFDDDNDNAFFVGFAFDEVCCGKCLAKCCEDVEKNLDRMLPVKQ